MSLKKLIQQNCNANFVGYSVSPSYTPHLEPMCSPQMDNRRVQILANTVGTLPRGRKQLALTRSSSFGDSSGAQRRLLAIVKEDNETFGFEIETRKLQPQNACSLEVCTFVCKIQEKSPAHLSGLQTGDILANINGVSTEGFSHKQMVDLIKSSGNYLRLETVNGASIVRRMELETKLQLLKQTLQEKWVEFRSLQLQEQRLLHGEVNDNSLVDALESEESNLFGSCASPKPAFPFKPRFSSESSCRSQLSSMTVDSEDSFYQTCVFEDSPHECLSRQSSTDDDCFFPRDNDTAIRKSSLRRNRSISVASNGSMSPLWEGGSFSNIFGTLPRKNRRGSVRKQLLKFIPGLHRAVEEEESRV
ncbi:cytohesin-interacting protein [Pelodiscus sinensis]|uniref:Cytohesin 1 interacting protein n=1 Tax=Pelodiscus sinensis TaxID=13735 RepID=K7FMQ6_PELSI|nr:cytohesin-interacting protein [Pelodiscus sinensis]|eukprot:XP_006125729.1 cytohesin-interacting protein [Pelodiscus sinensis]